MKPIYLVVDERSYGGGNPMCFSNKEHAEAYIDVIEKINPSYDLCIFEGEVKEENIEAYVTLTEKWWGAPCKIYSTQSEADNRAIHENHEKYDIISKIIRII